LGEGFDACGKIRKERTMMGSDPVNEWQMNALRDRALAAEEKNILLSASLRKVDGQLAEARALLERIATAAEDIAVATEIRALDDGLVSGVRAFLERTKP
jgi:hypothetical protein